jgi:type V secretory pathway adhesin AidA
MGKYIYQLRKGVRYVDEHGNTLLNSDGTPVRDDWTTYTNKENHINPLDGELVLEYEYNPTTGKKIPRFKIGCDDKIFANLDYVSPDSFIMPKPASVTLYANKWSMAADDRWYQQVSVDNATITPNSKIDLQPNSEQLNIFHQKDLAFVAENDNGTVEVYCIGQKPTNDYTIQTTITEVIVNA